MVWTPRRCSPRQRSGGDQQASRLSLGEGSLIGTGGEGGKQYCCLLSNHHVHITCRTGVRQCKHRLAPTSFSFFCCYISPSRARLLLILLRLTLRQAQLSLAFTVPIRQTVMGCLGVPLPAAASLGRARAASASKAMPRKAAASLGLALPRLESKGRARAMLEYGEKPGRRLGRRRIS